MKFYEVDNNKLININSIKLIEIDDYDSSRVRVTTLNDEYFYKSFGSPEGAFDEFNRLKEELEIW
jgi:hypothetical protein